MPNDFRPETISRAQAQTGEMFGYQWQRRTSWESDPARSFERSWLVEKHGDVANAAWWSDLPTRPVLLDAGCGGGLSVIELFGKRLRSVDYVGVDISDAIAVAEERLTALGVSGRFIRSDFTKLPTINADVIFAEGTLHHTDSTEGAFKHLARMLRPGGRFILYVYRRKGPIREFTDDLIRDAIKDMMPADAWAALEPLTKLGKALGELNIEIDIPEAIDVLQIPAGRINLQRFFYWHVCKTFYRPEMTLEEMNHLNFDWFSPINCHRHTEAEVRQWCTDVGLVVEHEHLQEAGITVHARKPAAVMAESPLS